jgi:hypothetical protein
MRLRGPRQQLSLPFAGFPPVARTSRNLPSFCLTLQLRRPPASTESLPPQFPRRQVTIFIIFFSLPKDYQQKSLGKQASEMNDSFRDASLRKRSATFGRELPHKLPATERCENENP